MKIDCSYVGSNSGGFCGLDAFSRNVDAPGIDFVGCRFDPARHVAGHFEGHADFLDGRVQRLARDE